MMLIVGENNTGKSNLLHALRLLFDIQADRLRLDLSEEDINDVALEKGEKWFEITVELGDLQKHPELEAVFHDRIDQAGTETFITVRGRYALDQENAWAMHLMPPAGRNNEPVNFSYRMQRSVPLYFIEAARDVERETRTVGQGLLARLIQEMDYSEVRSDVQQSLKEANQKFAQGTHVKDLSDSLSQQFSTSVSGGQGTISLAIANEDAVFLNRGIHIRVSKSAHETPQSVARHGTGLQNLALMAVYKHIAASAKTGQAMLAVEEPESHLHPHMQRRLFRDLAESSNPIILTTHAPTVVENADPLAIVRLYDNGSARTSACQLNEATVDDETRKQLRQLMQKGKTDIFFARAIIIVEGESESVLLKAFSGLLNIDLDRDGISIVEAGGNRFAYIIKFCNAYHIPYVVLYDTDVLSNDNVLLKEACKADLITSQQRDACSNQTPDVQDRRNAVLNTISWIGVDSCLEYVCCRDGYIDAVRGFIENEDRGAFEAYAKSRSKSSISDLSADEIVEFLRSKRKLKVPVAYCVAENASTMNRVPLPLEEALRRAAELVNRGEA